MSRHLPLTRPSLPVLRRGRGTVQIGVDPERAVVVDRLSDDAATALMHLDGLTGRHQLVAHSPELGPVLDQLHRRGLLDDDPGPSHTLSTLRRTAHAADLAGIARTRTSTEAALRTWARRTRSTVVLRGNDRTATHIALGLAAAGIGTVALDGPDRAVGPGDLTPLGPFEVGPSWRQELSEALRRQGTHPTSVTMRTKAPVLVIVCSAADVDLPWTDPELADDLLFDGTRHLAVAVTADTARVGPLVLPGTSACLWCLDHRARDLDPAWPALSDQIRLHHPVARAHSSVLAALAGSYAVAQALRVVDGFDPADPPATLDAQVEFREPECRPVVLRAARHPVCGCGWSEETDTMVG